MSARQRFAGLSPNLQGAAWMVAAATVFSINGVLVKELAGGGMSFWQIAFARAFFALIALLPFLLRDGAAAFRTDYPLTHLARALCGAGAMTAGFYALSELPLALVTAIGFTSPLFSIVLSVLVLREVVRWRRWSATAVGFLGMLVMVRPGAGTLEPALYHWQDPTLEQWLLLVGVGVVGVAAQAMIVNAYRTGEISFVAPFDYSRLIGAGLLGFLFFAEVPDLYTLVGAAVIIGSSLYIARREAQLGRPSPPPVDRG
jgi:drug/metabolite transporter (DMT)-like permease